MSGDEKKNSLRTMAGIFLVFETTHLTMKAESVLREEGIPHRLFPKPGSVISECGLVIKVPESDLEAAVEKCTRKGVGVREILNIKKEVLR